VLGKRENFWHPEKENKKKKKRKLRNSSGSPVCDNFCDLLAAVRMASGRPAGPKKILQMRGGDFSCAAENPRAQAAQMDGSAV